MIKRFLFASMMVGAVGLPYALSSSGDWLKGMASRFTASDPAASAQAGQTQSTSGTGTPREQALADTLKPSPSGQAIEGAAVHDLSEVLRFDGTPEWVMARWPRVTAGLSDLDLQGYRVPLVTGTGPDDLAGSLTYYFDKNRQMERIIFRGTTGDPRKLVGIMSSQYHFRPQPSDDPSLALYQVKWNGKPHSELRVRTAKVVRAQQPNSRFEVSLAIRRP